MEPESQYDEVITRYLLNEASPEEERFVCEWMAAGEKNRLYIEELQRTLRLISSANKSAKLNVEAEWEHLRHNVFEEQSKGLHINQNKEHDRESLGEARQERPRIYRILIGAAVAASLIFMIGLGAGWFSLGLGQENIAPPREAVTKENSKTDLLTLAKEWHEVNTSGKTKQLILPDGSEVALFNNSELRYKEPVNNSRREIYLSGIADFQVKKDKLKPFTVFSEDVSTTAIGTAFTVTAIQKEKFITVKLNEGKVVVKFQNGRTGNVTDSLYLIPGQEVVYDKSLRKATVRFIREMKPADKRSKNAAEDSPSVPHYGKGSWFMFNNQSLSEIFNTLSEMYNVKIVYSKKDVRNMYFIGTYDRSESLENILNEIALLNNLKVIKENSTYRIKKK